MLARGFGDPVHDAQAVFRAVMDALARPGTVVSLAVDLVPPAPLSAELAGIALALADADTPIWLDTALGRSPEVATFLRFHTGAPIVEDPADATFALIAEPESCPDFEAFAQGTPDYPDRSTTLVLAAEPISAEAGFVLEGPGIRGTARLSARPLPEGFAERIAVNHELFPLGVDLLLAGRGSVAGLPRSVRVHPEREAV